MIGEKTYYEILGVDEDVTPAELRKAYHLLMKQHHPDIASTPEDEELSKNISIAYGVLSREDSREEYDLTLQPTEIDEEVVEEEFTPTWGEETSWGEETTSTSSSTDDYDDSDDTSTSDKTRRRNDFSRTRTAAEVPESIRKGSVRFVGFTKQIFLSILLPIIMTLIALVYSLLNPDGMKMLVGEQTVLITALASIAFGAVAFVHAKESPSKNSVTMGSMIVSIVIVGIIGLLAFYISGSIPIEYRNLLLILVSSPIAAFFTGPSFWRLYNDNKVISHKTLKNNNSFGSQSGDSVDAMTEEILESMWGIPGLRVVRVKNNGFSHMLFFNNKIILLKGLYLPVPGDVKFAGPNVLLRRSDGTFIELLNNYLGGLNRFHKHLGKDLKAYPILIAMPGANMNSYEKLDGVEVVTSNKAVEVISEIMFENETENVVDHAVVIRGVSAAYK